MRLLELGLGLRKTFIACLESGHIMPDQINLVAHFLFRCAFALNHFGQGVKVLLKCFDKYIEPWSTNRVKFRISRQFEPVHAGYHFVTFARISNARSIPKTVKL